MVLFPQEYRFVLQNDLMSFTERAFCELNPGVRLLWNPYIEAITAKLEAVLRGEIKRLAITLPPRSLKSHCASIAFPAWCHGKHPEMRIICASYGQELADKLARDTRTLMNSTFYKSLFPHTCLSLEKQAVADFMTTQQGFRMATSVGGTLTGRGADLIILDDPLKPVEALSETSRKAVNEWYSGTLLSRLNDKAKGAIIIIMQRLHQDDLVGHVLEQDGWEVLSFPAIATQDEEYIIDSALGRHVFRRREGEALHPEREPLEVLKKIRRDIGEYNFLSQYQQDPCPVAGMLVKKEWFQYYEPISPPKNFSMIVQSWDTAQKAKELNDYSVCTTWGLKDGKYYLLHVFRKRLEYPDLKRAVHDLAKQYRPNRILIEDKASGTSLIQDLKAECLFAVTPYEPPSGTDKVMRLVAVTPSIEAGLVFLPREAAWLEDYIREMTAFPGGKYDDQVDSSTQALASLSKDKGLEVWIKLAR